MGRIGQDKQSKACHPLWLREALLHRIVDLFGAAVELFEKQRKIPAFVMTRAVLESVAVLFVASERMREAVEACDVAPFDKFFTKVIMGSRNDITPVLALNILTFMDKVDRKIEGYRAAYDSLCEYAHPNWSGTVGQYSRVVQAEAMIYFGPEVKDLSRDVITGLPLLSMAGLIVPEYYNSMGELMPRYLEMHEAKVSV
jgi:hypothetical protein